MSEEEKNAKLDEKFRYAVPDDMIKELYISKDTLREKIEIYRIAISDSKDGDFIHDARQKIQVLKELLED